MSSTANTPMTLASDAAYALIGAGDAALAQVRRLADRREELPEDLARQVEDALQALRGTLEDVARHLEDEVSQTRDQVVSATTDTFGDFAERGRSIVDRLSRNDDVERAAGDIDNAQARVKGLVTTLRNSGDAVIGKLKAVRTTSTDAASSVGTAAKSAAKDVAKPRRTADLDSLTKSELYELASQRDIDGRSGMNKDQLISALKAS